jgi:integrase
VRGQGRIYQPKGRKVWMLAYWVGPEDARRLVRESAKTEDEETARKRLEQRIRQARNADEGISDFEEPRHRRVTVNVLFDELLADYRRREIKDLHHVELRLKPDKPLRVTFGPRRASALATADVVRYVNDRKAAERANATINREVEILRRALRLGIETKRILRMPPFPKKLREKNARQGFFELEDFRKVLAHLPGPLDDVCCFAFDTGWRRGMLLGMKWSDVDRAGRTVTLPDSKNDDPQTVPLDGELWEVIERRWKMREFLGPFGSIGVSEFVFHRNGKRIPTSTFEVQFRRANEAAGVVGRIFHDLRRTAARNMVRAGVPQSIAQRVTGHRSASMFNRYDITSTDDKLEALKKARVYAESRVAVGQNVKRFPTEKATQQAHVSETPHVSSEILVAVQGFEPRTQRI